MKRFITVAVCIIGLAICSTNVKAQYTLDSIDVEIVNGTIVKCTYDYSDTDIVIPDSLHSQKIIGIGSEVFSNHGGNQIISVELPEGLETIEQKAFQNQALTSLNLPTTVTFIGNQAFINNQIDNLTIPANVQAIDDNAFSDNGMTTLILEEGIVSIGQYSFNNNNLTNLIIPNSVTNLEDGAFQSNQISALTMGTGVKQIKNRTFGDNRITTLVIPDGVTNIENEAFADNLITSLTLPESVTTINAPFSGNAIAEVNGEPSNGIIFGRYGDGSINNTQIASYGGVANVIDFIPETVTTIRNGSFQNNGLTSVITPGSLRDIDHRAFAENNIVSLILNEGLQHINGMAFFNNYLTSLDIPSTVTNLGGGFVNMNTISTINGEATNGIIYALTDDGSGTVDSTKVISYAGSQKVITADLFPENLTTIGDNAFQNSELTSVTLPSSVTHIDNSAFSNNLLTSVTLPVGVTTIRSSAFDNNKLENITIPSSVVTLGSWAFSNNLLTSVTLPGTLTIIENGVFNNNKLSGINIPSAATYIGNNAFSSNEIASLSIPSSITEISSSAFSSNLLVSINIPGTVEKIDDGAFSENSLTSLTLNDGLKVMGKNVFRNNQLAQNDLSLPASLSSIGKDAFTNNSGLDSIYLHNPTAPGFTKWVNGYGNDEIIDTWVTDLGTSYIADVELTLANGDIEIIDGIIQSVNYDIRANIITIPRILKNQVVLGFRDDYDNTGQWVGGLFQNRDLKSVELPTSLIQIGNNAFNTNKLDSISIPDSTRYIGNSAFENNEGITSLSLPDPADPNFIEWTDNNSSVYAGGTTIYNLNNAFTAQYLYTLTNDDVVVENGAIVSCSYDFKDKNIVIPNILDNQAVISIAEAWKENENGPYSEGMFQSKGIVTVQLPTTLDTIGYNAFSWNQIKSIVLPEGVRYIYNGAFQGNRLPGVSIPDNVTYIGGAAFQENLFAEITLPTPQSIDFVYWYDGKLNTFTAGEKVSNLGESYSALLKYTLTDEDVVMENGAITSCSYDFSSKYIIIPETLDEQQVTTIRRIRKEYEGGWYETGMFNEKDIVVVELPSTLDSISQDAFGNNRLTYLEIPEGVKYIGHSAFYGNRLDSISLPDSIPTNYSVFNNNKIKKLNGKAFDGIFYKINDDGSTDSTTIAYYGNNVPVIDFIDEAVLQIEESAFSWCNISQIFLPTNIITIGDYAFHGSQITSVSFPNSVTYIGQGAFAEGPISEFTLPTPQSDDFVYWYDDNSNNYPAGTKVTDLNTSYSALMKYTLTDDDVVMENGAITSCSYDFKSKYIIIPETLDGQEVVTIRRSWEENEDGWYETGMFSNQQLVAVELPATLDTISQDAFGNNQLTYIEIPEGVNYIGQSAFYGNRLDSITIPDGIPTNNSVFTKNRIKKLNGNPFDGIFYKINDDGSTDSTTIAYYGNDEHVINFIDAAVLHIEPSAFIWCNVSQVFLPTNIITIGDYAFHGSQITSVSFPNSVTYIGQGAFAEGPMSEFTLPIPQSDDFVYWYDDNSNNFPAGTKVTDLNTNYSALMKYTLTDNDVVMENGAITSCSYDFKSKYIVIPETLDGQDVTKIAEVWYEDEHGSSWTGMFANKNLIAVNLPSTLDTISPNAFYGNKLSYIKIPDGVKHIDNNAFADNRLDSVDMPNAIPTNQSVFNRNKIKKLNGNAFDGIFYKINNDGTIDSTTIAYFGSNDLVVDFIDESVLHIASGAFSGSYVEQVSMTTQIINIGDYAFNGTQLTNVTIPNSVTYIGDGAFAECPISEFKLPSPESDDFLYWYDNSDPINHFVPGTIVTNLWQRYTALIKYTLTDDDVVVENGAIIDHSYDYRSAFIEIPDTLDGQEVVSIREIMREYEEDGETYEYMAGMFQPIDHKYLIGVVLPASLDSLYANTFSFNHIDTVFFAEGIEYIGNAAFQGNRLKSIILPNSLNHIGGWAFEENRLNNITLPNPESNNFFYWLDRDMTKYQGGTDVSDFQREYIALAKYTLKDNDVVMENNAMVSTSLDIQFKYLVIPDTLDGQAVKSIHSYIIDEGDGPYTMGLFQGWDDYVLLGLELPQTLDSIDVNAFHWNRLDSLRLPNGLKYVGNSAFQNCALSEIQIPNSVQYIGYGAFADNNFSEITLPNPENDNFVFWYDQDGNLYSGGETTSALWNNFTAMAKYTLTDDDVVMENGVLVENNYDYRSRYIIIPEILDGQEVVKIADESNDPTYQGMFQGRGGLELIGLELPATLDTIGDHAFAWNMLEEIILPEELTYISNSAFHANNISGIELPTTLTYLGEGAFSDNNNSFTEMTLPTPPENLVWTDYDGNEYYGDVVNNFFTAYWLATPVSNKDLLDSNNLKLYPNPAVSELSINIYDYSEDLDLTIYATNGSIVYKNNDWKGESIKVSEFENGIYLVNIMDTAGKTVLNEKFVKE
ncbi:MAG: leucine-rich repeat domain-containing protein [Salinivirgaceae bacterium]|jgi:hypothetical protein|nr:leucine-rich repeat domain-containing protein [Salinivirgaceae bacterium]